MLDDGRSSRCRASGCCCSCGSPSAARSRSSRRATASRSRSPRPRSSPRRPTCASPASRSARSRKVERDRDGNATIATIEIEPQVRAARAATRGRSLRQKTLLGETYVELTLGHAGRAEGPRGRRCSTNAQVQDDRRARRDPRHARPVHAPGVPDLAAGRSARRSSDRGPRPQRRARQPARVRRGGRRPVRGARRAEQALGALVQEHRRGVRRADRARGPAARRSSRTATRSSPRSQREREDFAGPVEHLPDVPARVAADLRAPRALRARHAAARPRPRRRRCDDLRPDAASPSATLVARPQRLFVNLDPLHRRVASSRCRRTREILTGLRPMLGELGPWLVRAQPDPRLARRSTSTR